MLRTGFASTEKINLNFAPWGAKMFLKHFLFIIELWIVKIDHRARTLNSDPSRPFGLNHVKHVAAADLWFSGQKKVGKETGSQSQLFMTGELQTCNKLCRTIQLLLLHVNRHRQELWRVTSTSLQFHVCRPSYCMLYLLLEQKCDTFNCICLNPLYERLLCVKFS